MMECGFLIFFNRILLEKARGVYESNESLLFFRDRNSQKLSKSDDEYDWIVLSVFFFLQDWPDKKTTSKGSTSEIAAEAHHNFN